MATTTDAPFVQLFGGAAVVVGGATLTPPPGKPETAFAALALAGGAVVRTPALIDAMWGDRPPASSRALVHTHVSALRRALTTGSAPAPVPETVPGGYRLPLVPEQVDVLHFLGLSVDDVTDEEIAAALSTSAAPVLSGCDTEFAESWRVRISAQRTLLQHQGWFRRVDIGDSAAVLPDVRAAVAADPLWEGGVLLLARALDDTGRREEALSTLDRYRRQLAEELGLAPSSRVTHEHQRLLRGTAPAHPHVEGAQPPVLPAGAGGRQFEERQEPARRSRRRTTAVALAGAVLAASALGGWWFRTTQQVSPPPPAAGPALLIHDPQSGRLRETVELPVSPDAISLDSRNVWISSQTDRVIAHLEAADPQSIRVVGLAGPPTSVASSAGTATAGLGFSGQLVTIADGRAGPPRALIEGVEGRLTLATRQGAVWAATIDGQLLGPDLANPTATPVRVPGTPVRMAMDRDRAWVLTQDRRELVAVPLAGGDPVVSALRGVPVDVTADDGGAWAVTSGDDRLWHATAALGRVVATRPLPGPPAAVAVGPGVVWVAVTQPAMLLGYDPETLQPSSSLNLPRPPVDIAAEGDLLVVIVR